MSPAEATTKVLSLDQVRDLQLRAIEDGDLILDAICALALSGTSPLEYCKNVLDAEWVG
jgi:hypothetical protein